MTITVYFIPHKITDEELGLSSRPIPKHESHSLLLLRNVQKHISKKYHILEKYSLEWNDLKDADVVWFHNLSTTAVRRRFSLVPRRVLSTCLVTKHLKRHPRPIFIAGVRGPFGLKRSKKYLKVFDAITVNNKDILNEVSRLGLKTYLVYAGIDTSLFTPQPKLRPKEFTIGWAGDETKKMKNFHLIHKLGYPYRVANYQNYIPHDEMPNFYNSLSAYTYFSSFEGCNRTILEACACGLPVISTDVGAAFDILDPQWLINATPFDEDRIVREIRNKLDILSSDKKLRIEVGMRNREKVLEWSWSSIAKQVEHVLQEVC